MRIAFPLLLALALGCGKSSPPPGSTVRGTLTFQGRPVVGGTVVLVPDRERGFDGKPIRAETDAGGAFRFESDVPPGWYRVALAGPPALDTGSLAVFPAKLARPDLSGQLREVKAGHDHVFEFAVEMATP